MTVTRAWFVLMLLAAASTALTMPASRGAVLVAAVLALSGAKARIILRSYLGLDAAPALRPAVDLFLVAILSLFWVLAVLA